MSPYPFHDPFKAAYREYEEFLLPIKVPQGANNLIHCTMIGMIGDIQIHVDTKKQTKNRKTYLCSVTARPDQSLSNTTINQFTLHVPP